MMDVQPSLVMGFGKMGRAVLDELARQLRQSYGEDNLARVIFLNFEFASVVGDPAVEGHTLFADPSDWIFESSSRPSLRHWFDKSYYQRNLARFSLDTLDRQLARLCLFRFITQQPEYLITLFEERVGRIMYQRRLLRDTTELEHQTITLPVYMVGALTDPVMSGLYLDIAHILRLVTRRTAETRIILSGGVTTTERTKLASLYTILRELQRFGNSDNPYQLVRRFIYETSDQRYHETEASQQLIYEAWLHKADNLQDEDWAVMWADSLLPLLDLSFGENFTQALANKYAQKIEKKTFFISSLEAQSAVFPRQAILDHWSQQAAHAAFRLWIGEKPSSHHRLERWAKGELVSDAFSGIDIQTPGFVAEVWQMSTAGSTPSEISRHYQDSSRCFAMLKVVLGSDIIPDEFRPGSLLSSAEDYEPNQVDSFHRFVISLIKNKFSDLDKPQDFRQGQYWQNHHHKLKNDLIIFRGHLYGWALRLLRDENLGIVTVHYLLQQFHQMLRQVEQVLATMLDRQKKDSVVPILPNRLQGLLPFIEKLPTQNTGILGRLKFSRVDEGFQNYLDEADKIVGFLSQWTALTLFYEMVQECQTITAPLLEHLSQWKHALVDLPTSLYNRLTQVSIFDVTDRPSRYKAFDANWVQHEYEKRISPQQISEWTGAIKWELQQSDQNPRFYPFLDEDTSLDWRGPLEIQAENFQLWQAYFKNLIYNQNSRLNLWTYLTEASAQNNNLQQIKTFFQRPITPLPHLDSGDVGRVATTLTWLILPQAKTPAKAELEYRKRLRDALPSPAFTEAEITELRQTRLTKLVFKEYIPLHGTEVYQQSVQEYFGGVLNEQQRHRTAIFAEEVQTIHREYDIEQAFRLKDFKLSTSLSLMTGDPDKIDLFMWGHLLHFISIGSDIAQDFLKFCLRPSEDEILHQRIDQCLRRDVEKWIYDWQDHNRAFPDPEIGRMVEQLQATPCAERAARLGYERLLLVEYEQDMLGKQAALISPDPVQHDLYRLLIVVARNGLSQRRTQIRDMLNSC